MNEMSNWFYSGEYRKKTNEQLSNFHNVITLKNQLYEYSSVLKK